ncbi:YaeQ family protein [Pseudoalteromonas sp. JBTF-M23]|uniref:YaeQ family protein n=1 Tax=Pseudoalteromonas caenipelagi TaxID=2726988 RepID=A0A849V8L9_9GAMM|nr:YaeQ family protein [Pseudoalteromonas caenipelagi]NOU49215.1 YaeQ family protein [Pseudoalteromonas caenipelagi]
MSKPFVFKARLNVADLFHHANHQEVFTTALQKAETLDHFVLKLLGYCALSYEQEAHLNSLSEKQKPDVWLEDEQGYITVALYAGEMDLEDIVRVAKQSQKLVLLIKEGAQWFDSVSERLSYVDNISIFQLEADFIDSLSEALSRSLHWDIVIEQNQISVSDKTEYYETTVVKLV